MSDYSGGSGSGSGGRSGAGRDRDRERSSSHHHRNRDRDRDMERSRDYSRDRDRDRHRLRDDRDRDSSRGRGGGGGERDSSRSRGGGDREHSRGGGDREHRRERDRNRDSSRSDRDRGRHGANGFASPQLQSGRPMAGRGRVAPSFVGDGPRTPPMPMDPERRRSRSPVEFRRSRSPVEIRRPLENHSANPQPSGGNGSNGANQPGSLNGGPAPAPMEVVESGPSSHGRGGSGPAPGPVEAVEPGPSNGGSGRGRGGSGPGRGRGRGRGRGGGGEGRGAARGRGRREEGFDMVISNPANAQGQRKIKQAALGNSVPIQLEGNFFRVICKPDWCVFHYRVDFIPEETDTKIKKKLLRVHSQSLGAYVFDGSSLYTSNRLSPDPMSLFVMRDTDQQKVELRIRLVGQLASTDIMYLQLLNIIVRKCLETMELEEMGRHFYDRHQAVRIEAHHLELWPGVKTSMRNYENGLLFNVEITHKVLRLDSCLQMIYNLRQRGNDERQIKEGLVGSIIMTIYNRKTYRVDDLEWTTTPMSTFDMRGRQISFIDYFREKYNLIIRDATQPMLVSRPKKKDYHRGMTGPILLIPELCQMTGLTDEMRANNQLMRALATHLHTDPARRVGKLRDFIRRLKNTPGSQNELQRWGLDFQSNLVNFKGRTIPKERLIFGEQKVEFPNDKGYDWGAAFRDKPLFSSIPLKSWVMIVPSRDAHAVDKLISTMQRVSNPLRFPIAAPLNVRRMAETRPNDYAKAVEMVMDEFGGKVEMIFAILPKQALDTYAAVKKRTYLDFGVPSQCFVAKNAHNERGLMSICTKLVVQMAAKLGGEPWTVQIPLKKLMVIGFDVHHCGKRKGSSVGAMVATTSQTYAKYFSCTSFHNSREDISENMGTDFRKCVMAYLKLNDELPDRIIMYRDGVGEGQLNYVHETEVKAIELALNEIYTPKGRGPPKFTFIVVTKKINTRMFALDRGQRHVNPPPGTVADDEITLPERYDFYLVSQHARQGTVSPVSYHILKDTSGLEPDKMQRLTFKLCHLYFNWSGTVTVPAPCQYARKLAYLSGTSLGGKCHEKLSNLLYFL